MPTLEETHHLWHVKYTWIKGIRHNTTCMMHATLQMTQSAPLRSPASPRSQKHIQQMLQSFQRRVFVLLLKTALIRNKNIILKQTDQSYTRANPNPLVSTVHMRLCRTVVCSTAQNSCWSSLFPPDYHHRVDVYWRAGL